MSQASRNRCAASPKQLRSAVRSGASIVAACLVLLQLVAALHFALIPHRFSTGLSGLVHVHGAAQAAVRAPQRGLPRAALAPETASCGAESCPVGFAGAASILFAASPYSGRLEPSVIASVPASSGRALTRNRVLLSAPKTSPPSFRPLYA